MPLEKLGVLEERVTQMITLVKELQNQKKSLEEQIANLNQQVYNMTHDLEQGRHELTVLSQLKEENQRFQEERGQVYAKLEAMLNGLETIEN